MVAGWDQLGVNKAAATTESREGKYLIAVATSMPSSQNKEKNMEWELAVGQLSVVREEWIKSTPPSRRNSRKGRKKLWEALKSAGLATGTTRPLVWGVVKVKG